MSQVNNINVLVNQIERDKEDWIVCNKLGSAFYFVDERILYKEHHVVRSNENRVIQESDTEFFARLAHSMSVNPFVQVHVGKYAEVNVLYCHRRIFHLDNANKRILLIGTSCLVKGSYRDYMAEPMPPLDSGTIVRLNGNSFRIRINADHHSIFIRAKDLTNYSVELFTDPKEAEQHSDIFEDEGEQEDENEDNYELDPSYEPEDDGEDEDEQEVQQVQQIGNHLRRRTPRSRPRRSSADRD